MDKEKKEKRVYKRGFGTLGVVQIVLVMLKLFDLVEMSWLWAFAPTIAAAVIYALLLLGCVVVFGILKKREGGRRK